MADRRNAYVVINHEEQYAVWPAAAAPPAGWQAVAPAGTHDDLIAYLRTVHERTQDAELARVLKTLSSGSLLGR